MRTKKGHGCLVRDCCVIAVWRLQDGRPVESLRAENRRVSASRQISKLETQVCATYTRTHTQTSTGNAHCASPCSRVDSWLLQIRTPGRIYYLAAEHDNVYQAVSWVQVRGFFFIAVSCTAT